MSLTNTIPEQLLHHVETYGLAAGLNGASGSGGVGTPAPPWTFTADIDSAGEFGRAWLVVDGHSLQVFSPNGSKPNVDRVIPLSEVLEARAEMYVGNGRLEVRTAKETIP